MSLLNGEDFYEHVVPGLIYIETSTPGAGAEGVLPKGCDCTDCSPNCPCIERSGTLHSYECNDDCSCTGSCPNRILQNGPLKSLSVKSFEGKGFGVGTTDPVPKGAFVCEYAGEIISETEAEKRFSCQLETDSNYILVLREHFAGRVPVVTVIDPTLMGNIGRYLNHSCEPNLTLVPVRINSFVPHIGLFALRDISAGEELTYDYDLSHGCPIGTVPVSMNCPSADWHSGAVARNEQDGCSPMIKCRRKSTPFVDFVPCPDVSVPLSSKKCVCLSKYCRGYLPQNNKLFGDDC